MTMDHETRRLLERCHAQLCAAFALQLATAAAVAEAFGDAPRPTDLDDGRAAQLTRQLLRDLERALGERPFGTDAWLGLMIDGARRAAA